MLSIRLLGNSRLSIVEVWGSQKLHVDFRLGGSALLNPVLFKGRLYCLANFYF